MLHEIRDRLFISNRYDLPVYHHDSLDLLRLEEADAIYHVRCGEWQVPLLLRYRPSSLLNIGFAGAVDRSVMELPFFERVRTSRNWGGSVLLIADPALNRAPDLGLAWYVGTGQSDLTPLLRSIVEHVQRLCKATRLIFTGGSGGGFAALMASHQFPRSLAYVFNPQTAILNYYPAHVKKFLRHCFTGVDIDDPSMQRRLSCVERYRSGHSNYVYYLSNASDSFHIRNHLEPFGALWGIPSAGGVSKDGRVRIVVEDYAPGQGHVVPPPPVYRFHMKRALIFHERAFKDPWSGDEPAEETVLSPRETEPFGGAALRRIIFSIMKRIRKFR